MSGGFRILREARLDPQFPLSRQELVGLGAIILETLGLEGSAVTVRLVDDREIARLNSEFLDCVGPTNVLSFPAGDPSVDDGAGEDEGNFLGELALSVDALAREAALYGQPPAAHLTRLLSHGILHLAGYDHGHEMYALTDAAVDRILLGYPEYS